MTTPRWKVSVYVQGAEKPVCTSTFKTKEAADKYGDQQACQIRNMGSTHKVVISTCLRGDK